MDPRLIKPKAMPKPLLLKDYLLDDMSSCSSNGFKSFPRRQCCTSTVRLLIEIDHKNKQQQKEYLNFNKSPPALLKNPSRSALSVLQSVITAVKRHAFATGISPENKRLKKSILPRNLSKKILKKSSFLKRKSIQKEIGRWKSFDQLMKEDSQPLDVFNSSLTTTATDSNSKSWSGSDFTVLDECTSGNHPSDEVNLDLPQEVRNDTVELMKNGDVSTDSTTSSDSNIASRLFFFSLVPNI